MKRAGGLVSALIVASGIAACQGPSQDSGATTRSEASAAQQARPAATPDPADPRYQGALRRQSEVEDAASRDWTPPTGDKPVYTQDWLSTKIPLWNRYLKDLKGKPGVRFLEIGSFEGRSAIWFAQNILTGPDSSITCVDLFGDRLDQFFDHNVAVSGVAGRVHKMKGKSQEVLRTIPRQAMFDFVYVDGCHLATCTLADTVLSWDLLKVGGVMAFDDYPINTLLPPVERPGVGVDAFLAAFAPHVEILEKGYELVLRKKSEAY